MRHEPNTSDRPPRPRGRDLRLLALAVFLSATGDFVALIALALHVHDLTGSGLAVSALFAATMAPLVLMAPLAGALADRIESVRLIAVTAIASSVAGGLLAFAGELEAILVLTALLAAGSAISQPAEFALVQPAAAPGRLAEANGLIESARYAGFAAGPVLAGVLLATGGFRAALLVNAVSFLAIAALAGLLRVRRPPAPAEEGAAPVRAREGLDALFGDRVLRVLVLAASGALLFISASITVEVFYVKDVLGAGDAGYAALTTVWMASMIIGATVLTRRVTAASAATVALVALAVQGAGMAAQTAWVMLPAAMLGYAIGGLGHGLKNALLRTEIHRRVPESLHGRAFASYNALRNTAELAALGAGGVLVTAIGPRAALLIAGGGPVVAALAGLLRLRAARAPGVARRRRIGGLGTALGRVAPAAPRPPR